MSKSKREAIERELIARPLQSGMPWGWLRELLAENARLEQQVTDLEFSVDTIKLAYQQSEQRCAELEGALRRIHTQAENAAENNLTWDENIFVILEIAESALSQTSPKE